MKLESSWLRAAANHLLVAILRLLESYRPSSTERAGNSCYAETTMDRRSIVLAVLGTAEGKPLSPVQLQKALFLLQRNAPHLFDEHSTFAFAPYDYGPFDKGVYEEAATLQMAGMAEIENSPRGYRQYSASKAGLDESREIIAKLAAKDADYLKRVSDWVRSLSFAALVKSIYTAYPEMKENSVFAG